MTLTPLLETKCNCTVGDNIIGATEMRNNYGAIPSFKFINMPIALLDSFFIAPCKVIALNCLCLNFGIIALLLCFIFIFIASALLTIAIIVALSCS